MKRNHTSVEKPLGTTPLTAQIMMGWTHKQMFKWVRKHGYKASRAEYEIEIESERRRLTRETLACQRKPVLSGAERESISARIRSGEQWGLLSEADVAVGRRPLESLSDEELTERAERLRVSST